MKDLDQRISALREKKFKLCNGMFLDGFEYCRKEALEIIESLQISLSAQIEDKKHGIEAAKKEADFWRECLKNVKAELKIANKNIFRLADGIIDLLEQHSDSDDFLYDDGLSCNENAIGALFLAGLTIEENGKTKVNREALNQLQENK